MKGMEHKRFNNIKKVYHCAICERRKRWDENWFVRCPKCKKIK
jgi:DNA-directed RNA polymerase subunit RPC12/RpoP